jgi:hypothetical protein
MSRAVFIVTAMLIMVSFGAGYWAGYKGKEIPVPKPVTKYIPVEVPKTVVVDRPVAEYIYKTVEKVRVDTVYVPVEMKEYVVSDRYPLQVGAKTVSFRYFDPQRGGYQEDVYKVPPALVRFTLTGGVGFDAIRLAQGYRIEEVTPDINLRANLFFGKVGTFASVNTKLLDNDWQARVGVSYVLFSK